jgi:hypothetical protein
MLFLISFLERASFDGTAYRLQESRHILACTPNLGVLVPKALTRNNEKSCVENDCSSKYYASSSVCIVNSATHQTLEYYVSNTIVRHLMYFDTHQEIRQGQLRRSNPASF